MSIKCMLFLSLLSHVVVSVDGDDDGGGDD
jgi:hypothetical protein